MGATSVMTVFHCAIPGPAASLVFPPLIPPDSALELLSLFDFTTSLLTRRVAALPVFLWREVVGTPGHELEAWAGLSN